LSAEGLVDVHSRSGTYVATLARHDLEEMFDIRCALECLAAEKAVERITDVQLTEARRLLDVLGRPIKTAANRKTHEQANSAFHELIIRAAGNQRLMEMYESLAAHIALCRLHRIDQAWQLRVPQEQQEHEQIFAALEARDAKGLAKALRTHILRAKQTLQDIPE
jgi:DNA-binding GntR family transcriptional regulator